MSTEPRAGPLQERDGRAVSVLPSSYGDLTMLTIDWGDLRPTSGERTALEERVASFEPERESKLYVSRHDSGFEARMLVTVAERSAEVRLHDIDVTGAVEHMIELLEAVARELH